MTTKVQQNNSIIDVMLASYGGMDGLIDFLMSNDLGLTDQITPGENLVVNPPAAPYAPIVDPVVNDPVNFGKKTTTSTLGQSLFDLVCQEQGAMDGLFQFMLDNPNVDNIGYVPRPGSKFQTVRSTIAVKGKASYLETMGIKFSTAPSINKGGIGYMGIQIDFIVS